MSLVCITNDLPDLRPCVIVGEHAAHCDGWATRWDRDTEHRISTADDCKGCLPAPAEQGLLCWSCWEKWRDALKVAVDVITHLRSVDRAAQLDNAGVRAAASWVIPVPSTWRAADDLIVLLGHPTPGFPSDANVWEVDAITERFVDAIDPMSWALNHASAEAAVRVNAAMHSALIQHPMEDYEHRIRNVRCQDCKQKSLLWKPPLMFHGEVRVECTNTKCGFVVDQTGYAALSAAEQVYVKARLNVERTRIAAAKRAKASAARKAVVEAAKAERVAAFAAIPPDHPVPVSVAHHIIGCGRQTIYRWIEKGKLIPVGPAGAVTVTPAQVREAEANTPRGRPRRVGATKVGTK